MTVDLLADPDRRTERTTVFLSRRERARLIATAERESALRGRTVTQSEVIRGALRYGLDQMDQADEKNPHAGR